MLQYFWHAARGSWVVSIWAWRSTPWVTLACKVGVNEDIAVRIGVFIAVLARIGSSLPIGCREEG